MTDSALNKSDALLLQNAAVKWIHHIAEKMLEVVNYGGFEPDDYDWDEIAATIRVAGYTNPYGPFPEAAWPHLDAAFKAHLTDIPYAATAPLLAALRRILNSHYVLWSHLPNGRARGIRIDAEASGAHEAALAAISKAERKQQ